MIFLFIIFGSVALLIAPFLCALILGLLYMRGTSRLGKAFAFAGALSYLQLVTPLVTNRNGEVFLGMTVVSGLAAVIVTCHQLNAWFNEQPFQSAAERNAAAFKFVGVGQLALVAWVVLTCMGLVKFLDYLDRPW